MELHDPYRAPSRSVASDDPALPVDMSGITFTSDGRVSTAATIAAGYTSSIIANRWMATLLDFVALGVTVTVAMGALDGRFAQVAIWPCLALLVAYYPVMETCFGGTLGKLATGIRVVNIDGRRPAWWQSIVRTLLRLVEVNPVLFGAIPAGLVALFTPHRQRVGDLLASTYVLRTADIGRIRPAGMPRSEPVWNAGRVSAPPPLPPPLPPVG